MTLPHVVIVGGFAGLRCAQGLAKAAAQVTVVDRFNHHLFQPLLYQVATAGLSPAQIASPVRSVLRKQSNTEVLLGEVTGIDTERHEVVVALGSGERRVPYDYLVVATGSRYNYFAHPEWEQHAPSLKTIQDALRIRASILLAFESAELEQDTARRRALLTIAVVGGGPTGVELAGAIAELAHHTLTRDFRHIEPGHARVLLIEAGPRLLAALPERLAVKAQKRLEQLGVEVRTGARAEEITPEGVVLKGPHPSPLSPPQTGDPTTGEGTEQGGERIAARTVLWAAGVAASPAGRLLGATVDRSGRVIVGADLSLPKHPDVFVLGDTVLVAGRDGKPLPGLAPVAMQEGSYAAKVILAHLKRAPPPPAFRYRNRGNLATVGRAYAVADLGAVKAAGLFAWLLWLVMHILYLIGFRNKMTVMIEWGWAYVTYERGARLITDHQSAPWAHIGEGG